jgi:hypothetical protein
VLAHELGLGETRPAATSTAPRAPRPPERTRSEGPPERRGGPDRERRIGDRRTPVRPREHGSERELVSAMLHQRSLIEAVSERIGPEVFRDGRYRDIFAALLRLGAEVPVEMLAESLDPDALEAMQVLLGEANAQIDHRATADRALTELRIRELEDEQRQLDRDLVYATAEEKDDIIRRKVALKKEMTALGNSPARLKSFSNRK